MGLVDLPALLMLLQTSVVLVQIGDCARHAVDGPLELELRGLLIYSGGVADLLAREVPELPVAAVAFDASVLDGLRSLLQSLDVLLLSLLVPL